MLSEPQVLENHSDCIEDVMRYIREHIGEPLNRLPREAHAAGGRAPRQAGARPRSGQRAVADHARTRPRRGCPARRRRRR